MVVIGFSLTASAQRQPPEERKKPPKNNAEIKPEEKAKEVKKQIGDRIVKGENQVASQPFDF